MNRLGGEINRNRLVWMVFSILAVEAVFSIGFLNWQLATGSVGTAAFLLILLLTLVACGAVWKWRNRWSGMLSSFARLFEPVRTPYWIGFCFVVGLLLRLTWVWAYPAPQQSDHATYFQLGRLVLVDHHYGFPGGGLAYWPPGYPFFLAAWFFLLGIHDWIPLLANLVLYGGTLIVVERLATRIAGTIAGKVSAFLLVAWPTLVMTAGLASKEMLVLFLVPASLLLFAISLDSASPRRALPIVTLAGLLLGFASLTQPSLLTFPAVLLVFIWLRKRSYVKDFGYLVVVIFAMAVVIVPWTLRNHRVLGAWVPISTNGGDVFYRANNPLATGGYTVQGEQDLGNYDELTRNSLGFRLGKHWLYSHPQQFLFLAIRKQILFLGDDAQGAFETLKRGLGIGGASYALWKGISNAYWIGLWLLILAGLIIHSSDPISQNPLLVTAAVSILYLFAIHSIFESGAKYHQPVAGFLLVLAAQAFVSRETTDQFPT
jgi:4-amino-4-deoxy-L-arabinose transferase-like glycosyltransferase